MNKLPFSRKYKKKSVKWQKAIQEWERLQQKSHFRYFGPIFVFFFQCAEEAGLPHDEIVNCYSSDVSVQLQLDAEQKTKQLAAPRPMLAFVPTIVYNHVIYCHIL